MKYYIHIKRRNDSLNFIPVTNNYWYCDVYWVEDGLEPGRHYAILTPNIELKTIFPNKVLPVSFDRLAMVVRKEWSRMLLMINAPTYEIAEDAIFSRIREKKDREDIVYFLEKEQRITYYVWGETEQTRQYNADYIKKTITYEENYH